jgi:hypothetical protein
MAHAAPMWCKACCPHVVSSTSHTCTWLRYGSQMAHATPIQPILAPIWPLHGARGSHMAPSALQMAHMAPMWCRQLQCWHNLPPIWCRQLPFGACGSIIVHAAPVWYQVVQSGSHLAPIWHTWLVYGAYGSHIVTIQRMWLLYGAICYPHGIRCSHWLSLGAPGSQLKAVHSIISAILCSLSTYCTNCWRH